MHYEKQVVANLLKESDEALIPRIRAVMDALGLPIEAQEKLLSDMPALRQKAENVSEFDLYRARLWLGEDGVKNLMSILEGDHGGPQ
ncbi:MAG: hypothetical protein IKT43_04760 [Clostridia bacterium]|nr:hypothetical protein [Clostridia bacterium]